MQTWYYFRVHYSTGHAEIVGTLAPSVQIAFERQRQSAMMREGYARTHPKRGWNKPPTVTRITAVAPPLADIRRTGMKDFLDAAAMSANNRY